MIERKSEHNTIPISSARNTEQISHSNLFQNDTNLVLFCSNERCGFQACEKEDYRTNRARRQGSNANIPNYMLFMFSLITLQRKQELM